MQNFSYEISFVLHMNETNFQNKNFALSLAFIMRLTGTRKWPIPNPRNWEKTGTSKALWDRLGRRMDIAPMKYVLFL